MHTHAQHRDIKCRQHAVFALGNLCANHENLERVVKAGCLKTIITYAFPSTDTSTNVQFQAVAALRGQPEICIGNVIGSNIFNIGAVLGGAGVLKPFAFVPEFADLGVTVVATILLVFVLRRANGVPRALGAVMALAYAGFLAFKVLTDNAGAG